MRGPLAVLALALAVAGAHTVVHTQTPAPLLPDAPGVDVVKTSCLGCHEGDLIASQRLSQAGWDREVAKMERWGAQLTPDDRRRLLEYLAPRFGVLPVSPRDERAVAAGEEVYARACRLCHEDDLSAQQRLNAAGWERTVDKMTRWGAQITADEHAPLVAYLVSRWGRPSPP